MNSRAWHSFWLAAAISLAAHPGQGAEPAPAKTASTNAALKTFELEDQFSVRHRVEFPRTNLCLITVADEKGAAQLREWLPVLREQYARQLSITGLACVGGVPRMFRGSVPSGFRREYAHPVLLDWEGKVTGRLGCARDQANLFLLDRTGRVLKAIHGPPTETALAELRVAISQALTPPGP